MSKNIESLRGFGALNVSVLPAILFVQHRTLDVSKKIRSGLQLSQGLDRERYFYVFRNFLSSVCYYGRCFCIHLILP